MTPDERVMPLPGATLAAQATKVQSNTTITYCPL
jgi:hypothetical protein